MTTTPGQADGGSHDHRHRRTDRKVAGVTSRTRSISLGAVGVVALVISAWGAVIPYLGPAYGFSADGSSQWHWNLSRAVLALIPGVIGCLFALSLMGRTGAAGVLRRLGLTVGGLLAIACGAWFVIGPMAWPVLVSGGRYFVTASPLRELEYQVGYALGPGLILAVCGAFAIGWATRHNRPLGSGAGLTEAAMVAPGVHADQRTNPPGGSDPVNSTMTPPEPL